MDRLQYWGLHNLVAPKGARKKPKRVGRGESSGHGKTSGRGAKGQKARKSGHVRVGFEGGQVPLSRRLPKVGFSNYRSRKEIQVVNLDAISQVFQEGAVIDSLALLAGGLIKHPYKKVKILGDGEVTGPFTFRVAQISEGAKEKIEAKGGTIELISSSSSKVSL